MPSIASLVIHGINSPKRDEMNNPEAHSRNAALWRARYGRRVKSSRMAAPYMGTGLGVKQTRKSRHEKIPTKRRPRERGISS